MCFGWGKKLERRTQSAERDIDSAITNIDNLLSELKLKKTTVSEFVRKEIEEKVKNNPEYKELSPKKLDKIKNEATNRVQQYLDGRIEELIEERGEQRTYKKIARLYQFIFLEN